MAVPNPKIGYNKKTDKKWPSYDPFYNSCFYYRKEAQKWPVLCSSHVGGSKMVVPIPNIGYNKNSGKKWPSYDPFFITAIFIIGRNISLRRAPKSCKYIEKNIQKPLKKFCKNLTQQVRVRVKTKCRNTPSFEEKPNGYQIESKSTTKWECPNDNRYWLKVIEGTRS